MLEGKGCAEPRGDAGAGLSLASEGRLRRAMTLPALPVLAFVLAFVAACAAESTAPPAWPTAAPAPSPEPAAPARPPENAALRAPTSVAPPGASSSVGRAPLYTLRGQASYYADSLAGNKTASGEIYRPEKLTAAHKTLRFGTVVRVVREDTGAHTTVTINDRGPFGDARRIIDLSRRAAEELAMIRAGVVPVRVEVLSEPDRK